MHKQHSSLVNYLAQVENRKKLTHPVWLGFELDMDAGLDNSIENWNFSVTHTT